VKKPVHTLMDMMPTGLLLCLLCLLLTDSETAMNGVRKGLSLVLETLIPSLFPFLVLSELVVRFRVGERIAVPLSRPLRRMFGTTRAGSVAIVIGFLCGMPVGSAAARTLYEQGKIGKRELQRILLFANIPGSGFLIGGVGSALFGDARAGIALFCIIASTSIFAGILLHLLGGSLPEMSNIPLYVTKNSQSLTDFTNGVSRALQNLLQVIAFVLFFSCLSECLSELAEALSPPTVIRVILCGILEMTSGISTAVTSLPVGTAFCVCAFLAGFSGISVFFQIFSILEKENPPISPYLLSKLLQGGFSALLAKLYLRLARPSFLEGISVFGDSFKEHVGSLPLPCGALLPLLLLLLATALLFAFKKAKA